MTRVKPKGTPLVRKLTIVLVVKLAVLTALWWGFVREQRVLVDDEAAAAHLLAPASVDNKE